MRLFCLAYVLYTGKHIKHINAGGDTHTHTHTLSTHTHTHTHTKMHAYADTKIDLYLTCRVSYITGANISSWRL